MRRLPIPDAFSLLVGDLDITAVDAIDDVVRGLAVNGATDGLNKKRETGRA